MEKKRIDITTILGWILGILVFLRTRPVYLWTVEETIRPICTIFVMLICVTNISREKGTFWIFLFLAASYVWAVVFVDHSGILTLLNFLTFAFIPIIRKELILKAYSVFRVILIFFFVLSIINYVLWLYNMAGVGEIIEPLNSLKTTKYLKFPFMVTTLGETSRRFYSIFDEPGVVGTICGLILISEQMNLRKLGNWVFLLAGALSLSFYFYVALIVGLVLFSTKLKFRWLIVPVFAAGLLVTYNNPFMYDIVWSRFEWDADEGWFAGDNRNNDDLTEHFETIVGTEEFFTGEGSKVAKDFYTSSSLNLVIVRHGLIFIVLNLLGFAILSLREIRNKFIWMSFFIFFILTNYQRPGFYGIYSMALYTMAIYNFGMNAEKLSDKLEMEKMAKEEKRKKRRLKRKKRFQLRTA